MVRWFIPHKFQGTGRCGFESQSCDATRLPPHNLVKYAKPDPDLFLAAADRLNDAGSLGRAGFSLATTIMTQSPLQKARRGNYLRSACWLSSRRHKCPSAWLHRLSCGVAWTTSRKARKRPPGSLPGLPSTTAAPTSGLVCRSLMASDPWALSARAVV